MKNVLLIIPLLYLLDKTDSTRTVVLTRRTQLIHFFIVLVKELPEKLTRQITHSIEKVVFQYGDITDPISGKKVVVGLYRDQINAANETFGKSDSAFDYDKAPPRGRLEGTRDFSHQETYIKWNEDGKDQPFAV